MNNTLENSYEKQQKEENGEESTDNYERTIAAIRAECLRIEEDSTYSFKGQYNAADTWSNVQIRVGLPTAILAAISGASAFLNESLIAGMLAVLVAALTATSTFLNPNDKANAHRRAGDFYLELRNRTRLFREFDLISGKSVESLRDYIETLATERDRLNRESPVISSKAYEKARAGIIRGEATYEVDKINKGKV